jgi:hypothetical protein
MAIFRRPINLKKLIQIIAKTQLMIYFWLTLARETYMKRQTPKLIELENKLKAVINEAQAGKLDKREAAEKITEIREAIDQILLSLKN